MPPLRPLLTIAALLLATPGPAAAQTGPYPAGTLPGGSYRATCVNVRFQQGNPYMLLANCRPKDSEIAAPVSRLNISPCREDTIYNDDGRLRCPFDRATQDVSDATRNHGAFRAAGVIVMGRDPDIATTIKWMRFGYTRTPFIAPLDQATLDFAQAADLLKLYLVEQATPQERREVFEAAYREVHGGVPAIILPGGDYDAEMKAGKAWYATIVLAERKKKYAPRPPMPTNTTPLPPIH